METSVAIDTWFKQSAGTGKSAWSRFNDFSSSILIVKLRNLALLLRQNLPREPGPWRENISGNSSCEITMACESGWRKLSRRNVDHDRSISCNPAPAPVGPLRGPPVRRRVLCGTMSYQVTWESPDD